MLISNPAPSVAYQTAISATANNGLLSVGPGPWDGASAGHFAGSGSGTGIAVNAPSGFAGNLLDLQQAGSNVFSITNATGDTRVYSNGQIWFRNSGVSFVMLFPTVSASKMFSIGVAGTLLVDATQLGLVGSPTLAARSVLSQTADLFQLQNNTGAVLSGGRADGLLYATLNALATKVKAGIPADADWTTAPPDGTIVGDSTDSKIYIRLGGVWKAVAVA